MSTMKRNPNWKPSCKRGELALLCDWVECGCGNTPMDWGFYFAKENTDKKSRKALPLKPTFTQRAGLAFVCCKCGRYIKYPKQAEFRKKEKESVNLDDIIRVIRKASGMLTKTQLRDFNEIAYNL